MRCSLSKFRQNVKMYDTVHILVMLFPRRFNGVKHGRTASVTESVHEKRVRYRLVMRCSLIKISTEGKDV